MFANSRLPRKKKAKPEISEEGNAVIDILVEPYELHIVKQNVRKI